MSKIKKERITLTKEELEDFDFTSESGTWVLRGEKYNYVETIRTDEFSDGESWDTVVIRESDNKYFKWNCWDAGDHNGYIMEHEENYMEEVFPKIISKTIYN